MKYILQFAVEGQTKAAAGTVAALRAGLEDRET